MGVDPDGRDWGTNKLTGKQKWFNGEVTGLFYSANSGKAFIYGQQLAGFGKFLNWGGWKAVFTGDWASGSHDGANSGTFTNMSLPDIQGDGANCSFTNGGFILTKREKLFDIWEGQGAAIKVKYHNGTLKVDVLSDYLAPGSHPFGPSFARYGQKAIMQSLAARDVILGVSLLNALVENVVFEIVENGSTQVHSLRYDGIDSEGYPFRSLGDSKTFRINLNTGDTIKAWRVKNWPSNWEKTNNW